VCDIGLFARYPRTDNTAGGVLECFSVLVNGSVADTAEIFAMPPNLKAGASVSVRLQSQLLKRHIMKLKDFTTTESQRGDISDICD